MTVDRLTGSLRLRRITLALIAERQAQREAESRADADAWCSATETIDSLLDDLLALRRVSISHGAAPATA